MKAFYASHVDYLQMKKIKKIPNPLQTKSFGPGESFFTSFQSGKKNWGSVPSFWKKYRFKNFFSQITKYKQRKIKIMVLGLTSYPNKPSFFVFHWTSDCNVFPKMQFFSNRAKSNFFGIKPPRIFFLGKFFLFFFQFK